MSTGIHFNPAHHEPQTLCLCDTTDKVAEFAIAAVLIAAALAFLPIVPAIGIAVIAGALCCGIDFGAVHPPPRTRIVHTRVPPPNRFVPHAAGRHPAPSPHRGRHHPIRGSRHRVGEEEGRAVHPRRARSGRHRVGG